MRDTFRTSLAIVCVLCCAQPAYSEQPASQRLIWRYNQGKFDESVVAYRTRAQNGDRQASLDLAVILKDLGNYDEAAFVLRRAQEKNGDDPEVLSLLARLYYLNGKVRNSLKVVDQVLAAKPDDIETNVLKGLCHEELGEEEAARQAYEMVLARDKDNLVARLSLAQLYYRRNMLKESEENFKKVSILDSSIAKVYGYWGDVLYKLGNYKEAFRIYEKLRLMDPHNKGAKEKSDLAREKLGEEFFKGQHQKIVESRKEKSVRVTPFEAAERMRRVAVGLATGVKDDVKFKCSSRFEIKDHSGACHEGKPDLLYTVTRGEGSMAIGEEDAPALDSRGFSVRPLEPEGCLTFFALKTGSGNFWANLHDRSFRGAIELRLGAAGLDIINFVTLEEYLYSVVPSEMYSSWPVEALKAQAVAARSEAVFKAGRHKKEGFDFCPEVHCQAYFGVENETVKCRQAVDETRGIIMTYGGKPVDGIYSSTCGGHTQDNIFGEAEPVGYLKGVPDIADPSTVSFPHSPFALEAWLRYPPKGILCDVPQYLNASSFRWVRVYSAQDLSQIVAKTKPVGMVSKILVTKRNKSGHVEAVKIKGSEGFVVIEKELAIRKALGDLRSGLFKVEIKFGGDRLPEQFIFYGGGWGHGVGMCQAGACGLAVGGKGYKDILRHYFSNIDFDKIY